MSKQSKVTLPNEYFIFSTYYLSFVMMYIYPERFANQENLHHMNYVVISIDVWK